MELRNGETVKEFLESFGEINPLYLIIETPYFAYFYNKTEDVPPELLTEVVQDFTMGYDPIGAVTGMTIFID